MTFKACIFFVFLNLVLDLSKLCDKNFNRINNGFVNASSDPGSLNGGSVMAMAGKGCVALAIDKRFGSGPQMVNISPRRVLLLHSHLLVAFTGLQGDVESVAEELSIQASKRKYRGSSFAFGSDHSKEESNLIYCKENIKKNRAFVSQSKESETEWYNHKISPRAMAQLTAHVLYSRRASPYYCELVLAGLELIPNDANTDENEDECHYRPFLCAQDLIGAQSNDVKDYVCAGVAEESMYGVAEAMWRPNMDPETLVNVCGRAFLSALERDCLSGYGAIIYLLTNDGGITQYDLDTRND